MKEKISKVGYTLYLCPKCSNPSLIEVDSSVYKCFMCRDSENSSDSQQAEDKHPHFLSALFTALFLLLLFL